MKIKKLLCLAALMMMVFLVGCKKETLDSDLAALQYDWQFVQVDNAGEVVTHTPGFYSREPSAVFSDDTITFSVNGKNTHYGVVEAAEDCYNITFPDSSAKSLVAKLSDDGETLTITIEGYDIHFTFKKQE